MHPWSSSPPLFLPVWNVFLVNKKPFGEVSDLIFSAIILSLHISLSLTAIVCKDIWNQSCQEQSILFLHSLTDKLAKCEECTRAHTPFKVSFMFEQPQKLCPDDIFPKCLYICPAGPDLLLNAGYCRSRFVVFVQNWEQMSCKNLFAFSIHATFYAISLVFICISLPILGSVLAYLQNNMYK